MVKLKNKPWGLHFSKAPFEGLIFGRAYIRNLNFRQKEFSITKLIWLAYSGKEMYVLLCCCCFVLFCI